MCEKRRRIGRTADEREGKLGCGVAAVHHATVSIGLRRLRPIFSQPWQCGKVSPTVAR
jgi:hypothetical protein